MRSSVKKFLAASCLFIFLFSFFSTSMVSAVELPKATPGEKTVKNLLLTSLQPVGSTMYIWGGGWQDETTGEDNGSNHIGVLPEWKEFFLKQDSTYDYHDYLFQRNKGLDCGGFVGWCLYNIMNTESGKEPYVSSDICKDCYDRGWGSYKDRDAEGFQVTDFKPGDLMNPPGHIWISIGQCDDGSVVLIHSSPCGVQINGTQTPDGKSDSEAVALATYYMETYYPDWYVKYPCCERTSDYLTRSSQFRWDVSGNGVLLDPDGYMDQTPKEILEDLFSE